MKHLVLIAGIYYPEPSPTGRCAHQYVSLLKDEYIVDVIYISSNLEKIHGDVVDAERLYGLCHWRLWLEYWFGAKGKNCSTAILRRVLGFAVLWMKGIGRIQSVVLFPNNLRWCYKKAYKTLLEIHEANPVDVVFTVNSPFAAHLAGLAFKKKHPEVRWVAYTVDPYYAGYLSGQKNGVEGNNAFQAEKRVLSYADANLLSEEVYQNSTKLYDSIKEKTYPLPYLLLKPRQKEFKETFEDPCVHLVYAGRFYRELRSPKYLLETMLKIKNPEIKLHLYAVSDCEAMIDANVEKSHGRILRHAIVSSSEILKILLQADVLINVENTLPEFKPSKIFEYIAAGKPIVNFYSGDNPDPTLSLYPECLMIREGKDMMAENALRIETFCSGAKNRDVGWDAIDQIYSKHLPQEVQHILRKAIAGNLEKPSQNRECGAE